jgi:hypothetical protein
MVNKLKISGGLGVAAAVLSIASGAQAQMVGASAGQILERVNELNGTQVTETQGEVAQVTSVSELADVKPTDWAFSALQSLVERYGCIEGYPDRTFRGQRALSRYEFAAGLNACLDKVNEVISAGLADKVSKDDLGTLQRLQEDFAAELAALSGRAETLVGKVDRLEKQQFSTNTKLTGEVIFGFGGGSSGAEFGSDIITGTGNGKTATLLPGGSTNVTAHARVYLDFNTSFTGKDLLLTRLVAGNGGDGPQGALGAVSAPFNIGSIGLDGYGLAYAGVGSNFAIDTLRYDFPLNKNFKVSLGTNIFASDYVDLNSFANNESQDFASLFFTNNPLIFPVDAGSGAALDWNPGGGAVSIRAVYVAANASEPARGNNAAGFRTNRGLTGDPYQGTFEIEFAPRDKDGNIKNFALRLQYTNASVSNVTVNTGGVNLEWAFAKKAALFGRYGFGTIDSRITGIVNPAFDGFINKGVPVTSLSPQTWMVGLAFPDLLRRDDLLAFAVGQPFIESKVGNSTQTNLEIFYRFRVSDNISITPDLQFIFNPNNNNENSTITIGSLRTTFTF